MFDYQANVIGSLLASPSLLGECDLSPNEFDEHYSLMYQAILDVEASGDPVDIVSISERLQRDTGKNYFARIGELAKDFSIAKDVKSIKNYCGQVRHANRIESSKQIAQQLLQDAGKADDAIDNAIRDLMSLNETRKNFECSLSHGLSLAIDDIDYAFNHQGEVTGVVTGLKKLDSALGGFQQPDLYVIGARPAIGKTALLVNLLLAPKGPVGFISTEQPRNQIGMRTIALSGQVSLHKMRVGNMHDADWPKITAALSMLKDKQVRIYDNAAANINDVIRQARKWKQMYNIQALYVDYLQRINNNKKLSKKEQVDDNTIALKNIARELEIPVIALAQVNRECEGRPNKRPWTSDLADSSGIEKEADNVMLLYRDEVYNDDSPEKGIMEINITKNRHGPTGMIKAAWVAENLAVKDLEERYVA